MKLKQEREGGMERVRYRSSPTKHNAVTAMEDMMDLKYCIFASSVRFSVVDTTLVRQYAGT